MADAKRVFVLGAGTMGSGIAEICARANMEVGLYDVSPEAVSKGVAHIERSLQKAVDKKKIESSEARAIALRIAPAHEFSPARDADVIIEAVFEDLSLKKKLFSELSRLTDHAMLGTNTSSLPVTEIASVCEHPERVVGLHFFNPPPVMELLEIVLAEQTSPETLERARAFSRQLKKTEILVRDSPGFATSRLGNALGLEAIRMLESGVASAEDIDRAMELGYRHPMGPLRLADLIGLDIRLSVAEHLTRELGPQFTPPVMLRRLVRAGKLGKKTGEGFYRWVNGEAVSKSHRS